MTAIMSRSAVEFYSGKPAPPDLHSVVIDHHGRRVVTYAEHMATKRARQAQRLERIRYTDPWRAWRLSVWWSPGLGDGIFLGYHVWLDRIGEREWIRGEWPALYRVFPLILPFNTPDDWDRWIDAFLTSYKVGRLNGHPRAAATVWRRGHEIKKEGMK